MTTSITSTTPITPVRAREIMGRNFLGIEDVGRHYGGRFKDGSLPDVASIPSRFTETLEECKDTHLLVAGYPMTMLDVRAKVKKGTFYFNEDAWYNTEAFAANKKVGFRWYLIRKEIVPNSTSKTWSEQRKLLDPNDEVPKACELAYATVLYYLVTGERLFPNHARCIDVDSNGARVNVGGFDVYGLSIGSRFDGDDRDDVIGVASARRFD